MGDSARTERHLRNRDLLVIAALLVAASATWGPVFGDAQGYIAALGGVALGLAVAVLGFAASLTPWLTAIVGVIGYLAFGGLIALRATTRSGFIPTSRTIEMLLVQSIEGWKDLLTLAPPAGAFLGPTVLPYLVCTVAALAAGSVVLRTRHPEIAMVAVMGVLVSGILFGSRQAPLARWIGVVIGVLGLVWCSRVIERRWVTRTGGTGSSMHADAVRRRRGGAIALVAVGAVVSFALAPLVTDTEARYAVRDSVVPPLDLREFPSPLTDFRSYIDQREKETLFSVDGLPDKGRIRLATFDVYNGVIYNMTNEPSQGFRRIGPKVTDERQPAGTGVQQLRLEIAKYSGVWVPGTGDLRQISFSGGRADTLQSTLYYSPSEATALTLSGLKEGDYYTTFTTTYPHYTDKQLEGRSFGLTEMEENTNVPPAVETKAREILQGKGSPIQQARALEAYLKTQGFYADGKDGAPARPGHRNQRIQALLESEYMQGDDEQYAVAMALMARSVGMPARVVMGFYPESYKDGVLQIKGRDAHVWVEIDFEGAGWVTFDPTPPRDQRLTTQVPKPKPNPRPQVVQPPDPPDEPVDLPPATTEEDTKDGPRRREGAAWIRYGLIGSVLFLLLAGPFLFVLGYKAWRSRRRRRRGSLDQRAAGAWDDVLDVARDGRFAVDPRMTRSEQADSLTGAVTGRRAEADVGAISRAASLADCAVFSGEGVDESGLDAAWDSAEAAKTAIRGVSTRRSRLSLRSIGRRRRRVPKEEADVGVGAGHGGGGGDGEPGPEGASRGKLPSEGDTETMPAVAPATRRLRRPRRAGSSSGKAGSSGSGKGESSSGKAPPSPRTQESGGKEQGTGSGGPDAPGGK
ncbi:MAG: transglutaminaseTgpA domain-containing protein [Actinomycetaceae bacterium]|nr:transglutaminaseTgpA domain-containing protein [Actinomycetaceae bacterium]